MTVLTHSNLRTLPLRPHTTLLLAPDVRGSFERERKARPVTSGSGRSIEDAILSLVEGPRERELLQAPAEAA
jgi:hypothetical protein